MFKVLCKDNNNYAVILVSSHIFTFYSDPFIKYILHLHAHGGVATTVVIYTAAEGVSEELPVIGTTRVAWLCEPSVRPMARFYRSCPFHY